MCAWLSRRVVDGTGRAMIGHDGGDPYIIGHRHPSRMVYGGWYKACHRHLRRGVMIAGIEMWLVVDGGLRREP